MKGELQTKLPIGVVRESEWLRDYELVDLDNSSFKMIRDRNYLRSHPIRWTAMAVSLSLKSVGGVPVASEYRASNYGKIPDIVNEMPLADTSHVIVMSHINEFGPIITGLPAVCHICEKENVYDFDLNTLEVEYAEEPLEEIEVVLDTGYFKDKIKDAGLGIEGVKWTKYVIRIPRMKDAVRQESHYRVNDRGTFEERVLGSSGMKIFDSSDNEMDQKIVRQLNYRLIAGLRPRDQKTINHTISEIPQIDLRGRIQCKNCSRDTWIGVDPSFFFPRV